MRSTPALVLMACLVATGLTGCSRARLPVQPDARAQDYFREPLQQQLAVAVEKGDADGIAAVVKAGANVDKPGEQGIRPLMWAIVKDNVEGFGHLLEHGADPTVSFEDPRLLQRGWDTETVAELAARAQNKGFLRTMLAHGLNPNMVVRSDTGETLLFLMVERRDHEGAAMLVDAGADPNWRSCADQFPVEGAVQRSDFIGL